jgi:hypothetical protein
MADVTFNTVGSASTNSLSTSPTHTFAGIVNIPNTTGIALVAVIYGTGDLSVSGVTLGGATVSQLSIRDSNDGSAGGLWFGSVLHSAIGSAGAKDLVVTHSMGDNNTIIAGVKCLDGQHASTPLGTVSSAAGSTGAYGASVTDSVTGDMVVGAIATGSGVGAPNNTERWNLDVNGATAAGNAAGSTAPGASGTVTISWADNGDWWVAAAITVKQAAAGGRTTKNTRTSPLGVEIGMGWRMDP